MNERRDGQSQRSQRESHFENLDHFETRVVHSGESRARRVSRNGEARPDGTHEVAHDEGRPISTPIYASTTFSHPDAGTTERVLGGEESGYSYARWANPTVSAFEEALSELEDPSGGSRAFAVGSGMSAMHAALTAAELSGGATALAADQLYGSTVTLLMQIFAPTGVECRFFDACDLDEARKKIEECRPRAVVVESLSNPLLRVADVPALAEIAHDSGAALIVDNTFGTPLLQRPLELGADIVVHSGTKYLSGHGDVTVGVAAAGAPYDAALEQIRKTVGYVLGPFEAWLAHRGLKTLALRMERQCSSARRIATRLAENPRVGRVFHPSLEGHPDREVTGRVLSETGGLVSFELARGDREAAFEFLDALELCVCAPSLGDIYTIATHPATSSHREVPPSRRERLGVTEGLIRLSVGIEHPEDIASDIENALETL